MRTSLIVPVLASALLLAACGTDDPDTAETAATAPVPSTTSSSPVPGLSPAPSASAEPAEDQPAQDEAAEGEAPEFRADASPDTSPGEGNGLTVVDVRVGEHEGYDRVVFELGGTGTAGWRVEYEDDPRTDGEGAPVELDGEATLSVFLEGVGYPMDTGVEEYDGPRRPAPGLSSVRELQLGGVFEGYYSAFVGVADQRPFRVFRLQDPQRVVVDVAYGD